MLIDRILDPVIVTLLFALMAEAKPTGTAKAKARHLVPSIPGLVTVFIRPGDTPLQDINRDLAEAFDFNAVKHGRLAFGKDINAILNEQEKSKNIFNGSDLRNKDDLASVKENVDSNEVDTKLNTMDSHVQKIPRH